MNRNHSEDIPHTDEGPSPSKKFCLGVSSSDTSDQVANGAQQKAHKGKSNRKPFPTRRRPFITAGILHRLQEEAQNAAPGQISATSEQMASAARTSTCGAAPQFSSSELKALASMDSEHLKALAKMVCSPPSGHIWESQTMRPFSAQPPAAVRRLSEEMSTTRRSVNEMLTTAEMPAEGIPALPLLGSPFPTPSVLDPGKLEALTTMNSKKLIALKKAAAASSTIQSLLSKLHGNSEPQSCSSSQGGDHDNQCLSQEDDIIAEGIQYVLSSSEKEEECSDVNSDTCHFSPGQKNPRTFQPAENSRYMECKSVRAMDAECNKQFSNIEDDCSEDDDDGWYDHNRNKGNQQSFKKKQSSVGSSYGGYNKGSSRDKNHKDHGHFDSDKNWTYVDLDAPEETCYEDQVYDNTAEDAWEDYDQDDTEKILKQIVDMCRSKLACGMIGKRRRNAAVDDDGRRQSQVRRYADNCSNEEVGLLSQFLVLFHTWPDSSSSMQTLDNARVSCGFPLPVRFEVEDLAFNVRPLYTAVLSIGPFFLVRGLGVCRKTMERECFDQAVHILRTKSISEIRGLIDCGKDNLLEEVHRLSTEDPEAFTSLLFQEEEEEDMTFPEEAQASFTPQGPEHGEFEQQGVMCDSNTLQEPEHRGFPQQGVMCASNTPQGPEHRGFPQQGVMCASNTPQGPEHRGFPQQGVVCASNTPQGPEHRGFPQQGVMCASNTPQGPEHRGFPQQEVVCASNTLQEPEHRGFPQQGVMCASNTPQGPEHGGFPQQGVMCASNTSQGPEHRGFPQQGVMCASNTPQGPEHGGFPQQGVMCASNTSQGPEHRGFPQQVVCASNAPDRPEHRGFPQQGVMCASNTPQGPEHRGYPQQGVVCASNFPQGPEHRGYPQQGVVCASNFPQGPEHRGYPQQGVMCASNFPQGPEHRGYPQQGVMCASNFPQGPEHRGYPQQGVMCASNFPQGPEHRGFPQQGVVCASNTPQGPEHRGFPQQGVMCAETLPFSVHDSSKQQQQKKMPVPCQSSHVIQNTDNHEQTPSQNKTHTVHMSQSEGSDGTDKPVQFCETEVLNLPPNTGYTHSHIQRTDTEAVERKGNFQSAKSTVKMVAKVEPWENVQKMLTVQHTEHTQLEEKGSHSTQTPEKSVKQLKSEIRDPRSSAPKHNVEANVHQMPDLVNIHASVSQDVQKMQVTNKPESSTERKNEIKQKTTPSACKCEVLLMRKMKLLFQEMEKADLAENIDMIDYLDFMCVKVGIHVMILYRRHAAEHPQQPNGGDLKGHLICEIFYDTIQVGCGEGQTCSEAQDAAYAHLASRLMVSSIDTVVQGRRLPAQPESLPGFVQTVLKGSRKESEADPVQQSQGQKTQQASQSSYQ